MKEQDDQLIRGHEPVIAARHPQRPAPREFEKDRAGFEFELYVPPVIDTDVIEAWAVGCICGWTGPEHPPTEAGKLAARQAWWSEHAEPLLQTAVPDALARRGEAFRRDLMQLGADRPLAALAFARRLIGWGNDLSRLAAEQARTDGESWEAIAKAFYVSRQAAQQRFRSPVDADPLRFADRDAYYSAYPTVERGHVGTAVAGSDYPGAGSYHFLSRDGGRWLVTFSRQNSHAQAAHGTGRGNVVASSVGETGTGEVLVLAEDVPMEHADHELMPARSDALEWVMERCATLRQRVSAAARDDLFADDPDNELAPE